MNNFLYALLVSVSTAIIIGILNYGWRHRKYLFLALWIVTHPTRWIRVSVSALCSVRLSDKYFLVRQERRIEQFGPPGGAIDVFPSSRDFLTSVGFELERKFEPRWGISRAPLRGEIQAIRLIRFREWLRTNSDRESFRECVEREICEELPAVGINLNLIPRFRHFRDLRLVSEGPRYVSGREVWQWRMIQVYELGVEGEFDKGFVESLEASSGKSDGAVLATADEIRKGRTGDGKIIGSHAEYLLSKKSRRNEIA